MPLFFAFCLSQIEAFSAHNGTFEKEEICGLRMA